MMNPKDILNDLLEGNNEFAGSGKAMAWESCKSKQTPKVTAVMCADSRMPSYVFNRDELNFMFVVKNIGNQVDTSEGSIEYPVNHLKTPVLLIIGHTDCGAVKAAKGDFYAEPWPTARELFTLRKRLAPAITQGITDINELAQLNVDSQVATCVSKWKDKIEAGELLVAGIMFDFAKAISDKDCKVHLTNVNGDTDADMVSRL